MRKLLVIRRKGKIKMKSRNVLQLQYEVEGEKIVFKEYPIRDLDAILIIGRDVYVESSAISILSSINVPLIVVSGDSVGVLLNPVIVVNPHYRKLQYSLDKVEALKIVLEYIKARVDGMANILKYHRAEIPEIREPPDVVSDPDEFEYEIRLWESQASNSLWDRLILLIKSPVLNELRGRYDFLGRKPKHPDPFNKTLSVMYAVLYSLGTKALLAAGLDPTYGFMHKTRYSTPLTFDYVEMFKPVAIEATISLINDNGLPEIDEDGELKKEHVNLAIKTLYDYLTLKHKDTKKTMYQQIYLKAFCLASYLDGKCRKDWLTITWNRAQYRTRETTQIA